MTSTSRECQNFFDSTKQPEDFEKKKELAKSFVHRHAQEGNKIVLITSGGTTVPLESKTIRFIDNFSVGTRGSVSAEYFLSIGYAVIFLHRNRSLQPFHRYFAKTSILDILKIDGKSSVKVKDELAEKLYKVLSIYEGVKNAGKLLVIEYTTLADYLHLLKDVSLILDGQGRKAMIYLAAAVSDFYIPADEMPEHKIQSSSGPLNLSLRLVPKMLQPLVKDWAPDAFVVSFKLETDESLLLTKCKAAIAKYNHQVVIGNQLDTRKRRVLAVTKESVEEIKLTDSDVNQEIEIEKYIMQNLNDRHNMFISC